MNIGKFNFDQIIKLSFDNLKARFAFKGLVLAFFISWLASFSIKILEQYLISNLWLVGIDIVSTVFTVLIALYIILGLNLQIKTDLGKTKKKITNKEIFPVFGKLLGSLVIYVLATVIFFALLVVLGLAGKLPVAGPYLAALLGIPYTILAGFTLVFLLISGKLIVPAIAENPKRSAWQTIKEIFTIAKNNWLKITFNFILALLPTLSLIFTLLLVIGGGYLVYIALGWVMPSLVMLLKISMNIPTSLINIILTLSGLIIFAYAIARVIVLNTVILYSIYLDAKK